MWVCRYSIAVITSVSQTEEAGSTPVICSSGEPPQAVSRLSFTEPRIFSALNTISKPPTNPANVVGGDAHIAPHSKTG